MTEVAIKRKHDLGTMLPFWRCTRPSFSSPSRSSRPGRLADRPCYLRMFAVTGGCTLLQSSVLQAQPLLAICDGVPTRRPRARKACSGGRRTTAITTCTRIAGPTSLAGARGFWWSHLGWISPTSTTHRPKRISDFNRSRAPVPQQLSSTADGALRRGDLIPRRLGRVLGLHRGHGALLSRRS